LRASADGSPKPRRSTSFVEANRLAEPQEESCALEDESVGELGLRKSIQQALAAEARQRELVFDTKLAAPLNESRLYGSDDILETVALHMTTISRQKDRSRQWLASLTGESARRVAPLLREDRLAAAYYGEMKSAADADIRAALREAQGG
jgi:hypothetical protein